MPCGTFLEVTIWLGQMPPLVSLLPTLENISPLWMASLIRYSFEIWKLLSYTEFIFYKHHDTTLVSNSGFLLTRTSLQQIIGTAALIVCILAILDPYNNPIPQGLEAFTVGFVVLVIGLSMGFNSGYAVNPARDLGPRLFTAMAGWGSEVFT